MSTQSIAASPSGITIAYASSATQYHDATVSWSHPGTSLYTLEGLSVSFTAEPGGYYVYVVDQSNIGRGSYTGQVANLGQVTLELPKGSWSGRTSGSLTLRFRRPANSMARYTNISLILSYSSNAVPSTIVVPDAVAGEPQTVNITNTVSTVEHTVTWTYGSVTSGEQSYGASTRSPAWAVPAESLPDLYQANPNSGSIPGTITVKTLTADGALVGTSAASGRLAIPQNGDTLPSVSVALAKTKDSIASASSADYLQNHTTLRVTPTASARYGASVASISILTPDGSFGASSGSATEILLRTAGSYTISTTVTDSRGFTATDVRSITVTACPVPVLTGLDVIRCTASGVESDEGDYASITATASVTVSSWAYSITRTGSTTVVASGSLSGGSGIVGGSLDKDTGYTITVTITDSLGQTASASADIGTALYTIHRMAGGKGVAFGQISRRYGVEVTPDWPFFTHGTEIMELLVDTAHPVGSVIQTLDEAFDPNILWPWTRWGRLEDVFLLAAGTKHVLETGGASADLQSLDVSSASFTLQPQHMPQYTVFTRKSDNADSNANAQGYDSDDPPSGFPAAVGYRTHNTAANTITNPSTALRYVFSRSGAQAVSISGQSAAMPPFLAVNVWVRAR